jgi:primosomal replication protein N
LVSLMAADAEEVMRRSPASRTTKPIGPTGFLQCGFALSFRSELLEKGGQRQALLKLDTIHSHDGCLLGIGNQYAVFNRQ